MRRAFLSTLVLVVCTIVVAACSGGGSDDEDGPEGIEEAQSDDQESVAATRVYVDAPDDYVNLTNPFSEDDDAPIVGKEIFEDKCSECHGPGGAGDGPKAVNLNPRPTNLGETIATENLSDGYLFWRVSRGGLTEPFNSSMKNWDMALSEDERWQVISYIQTFAE